MAMAAAACGLGLLTGLLVGLSTAGVTASVVSALLAMAAGVAALTGVQNPFLPTGDSAAGRSTTHNWALFGFALAAVAGLGGGLWARTHDLLSPSPQEIASRWEAAGLSRESAARLAVLQLTGATLAEDGRVEVAADGQPSALASVLFSAVAAEDCQRTDPSRMPDADETRVAWSLAPAPWPALAESLTEAPQATLLAVWSGLCRDRR